MSEAETVKEKLEGLTEKMKEAILAKDFDAAQEICSNAMKIIPTNKILQLQLHNAMARVHFECSLTSSAIEESTKALEIDPNCLEALRMRGTCYLELEEWSEAIEDFERCCRIDQGVQFRDWLNKAKDRKKRADERFNQMKAAEQRKREESKRRMKEERERRRDERRQRAGERQRAKERQRAERRQRAEERQRKWREERRQKPMERTRTDLAEFYRIFGLDENATVEEIKIKYRELAKIHHPDRHSDSSEQVKRENEEIFSIITYANRELMKAKEK